MGAKKDPYHDLAVSVASHLPYDPVTTWPVVTETCYLLLQKQGTATVDSFLAGLQVTQIEIFHLQTIHFPVIRQLMKKYQNLPMDLADASLVILAEELGHGRILSTDQRDFQTYRWKNHQPFDNLLLPD